MEAPESFLPRGLFPSRRPHRYLALHRGSFGSHQESGESRRVEASRNSAERRVLRTAAVRCSRGSPTPRSTWSESFLQHQNMLVSHFVRERLARVVIEPMPSTTHDTKTDVAG